MNCIRQIPVPECFLPYTAFLHLLLVENRQMYAFYFSARRIVRKVATAAELDARVAGWEGAADFSYGALRADEACVDKAVANALWFLTDTNGCYRGATWLVGTIHVLALVMVVTVIMVSLVLFCRSGARSFSSPEYLVFTWQLEHTRAYNFLATSLLLHSLAVVTLALVLSTGIWDTVCFRMGPMELLISSGAEVFICVQSALSHLRPEDPAFDWRSPKFLKTTWRRGFLALLTQSNDRFAVEISEAILDAQADDVARLVDITPDAAAAAEGMEIARKRKDEQGAPLLLVAEA